MAAPVIERLPQTIYSGGSVAFGECAPSDRDHELMGLALEQARLAVAGGDSPVGAVLITPDGDVWEEQTREFRDKNPFAHAETLLMMRGAARYGRHMVGAELFTTTEPCVGCTYWIDKMQIGRLCIGAMRADGSFFRDRPVGMRDVLNKTPRHLVVVTGLRKAEALALHDPANRQHWDNGIRDPRH